MSVGLSRSSFMFSGLKALRLEKKTVLNFVRLRHKIDIFQLRFCRIISVDLSSEIIVMAFSFLLFGLVYQRQ